LVYAAADTYFPDELFAQKINFLVNKRVGDKMYLATHIYLSIRICINFGGLT